MSIGPVKVLISSTESTPTIEDLLMKKATLGQAAKVLALIEQSGVPSEYLQKILEAGWFSDLLACNVHEVDRKELRRVLGLKDAKSYKVIVDYSKSLTEMIAAGKYGYANSDINEANFPLTEKQLAVGIVQGLAGIKRAVAIELVAYGCRMATDDVRSDFEVCGLRAATLPELLAFGATYPEKQREYPIVALSSVLCSNGNRRVAYLWGDADGRDLELRWLDSGCSSDYRFLAVHK